MSCTTTMRELFAVRMLDGRAIGNGEMIPVMKHLSELYTKETALSVYQILHPQPQGQTLLDRSDTCIPQRRY